MPLTDSWLKANNGKAVDRIQTRSDQNGLGVRISKKGKLTFYVRYWLNGKQSRIDIGSYPLKSLKAARAEAEDIRRMVEDGQDPKLAKELERLSQAEAPSVAELFNEWYEKYCIKHKSNAHLIKRSFEIHLFPEIGHLPADQLELRHWMEQFERVQAGAPSIAERLVINSKQMLKWGVRRQRVPTNVIAHVGTRTDLHIKKNIGKRVLDRGEVRLVWEVLERSRMTRKNALFVMLCLAFGCRTGELRLSDKEHWDLDKGVWTVPPENHKTGKVTGLPIVRPIIEPVKELVREAMQLSASPSEGPLFNNRDSRERISRSSLLPLPYNIMQWLRRHRKVEMEHWSMHDLRRTVRTNLSDLTAPHIAEKMLGHTMPGQWRVYDHYDYLAEQKEAYQAWWERLQQMVAAGQAASSDAS
ncbi:tyrosine-type recombinase/integrase [Ectothiorhodospira mobilis]|uniref:tyrosine-type recombinase/integrase n=1 Tax=Ectothiorhodospira mobilis TaxID=195064 RepID=UPI00190372A9|nr:site-specific integrase [Ectothiorhodospira mobilis]MBK1691125.1 integrase [Ectothiorhodospira mobilis]